MKPIDHVSGLNEMYQSQGFPPYILQEEESTLQEWKPE